ncbi:hypothetical protein TNCV_2164201 [Trichonephila clavipes]|nr:hypothetical protein TNCV_2164201 [Trichonephila clavipes]
MIGMLLSWILAFLCARTWLSRPVFEVKQTPHSHSDEHMTFFQQVFGAAWPKLTLAQLNSTFTSLHFTSPIRTKRPFDHKGCRFEARVYGRLLREPLLAQFAVEKMLTDCILWKVTKCFFIEPLLVYQFLVLVWNEQPSTGHSSSSV